MENLEENEPVLLNEVVWGILTIKEQTALTLSYSLQKSSWEAGSTMKISHYKYLELLKRANHFFKIFTVHFDTYGELIPQSVQVSKSIRVYLEHTILERDKVQNILKKKGISDFKSVRKRELILTSFLTKLESKSKNRKAYRDLYSLILEFDRYNNFRIIPEKFQLPSPSVRKVKVVLKNLIKFQSNIDMYILIKLISMFKDTYSESDNLKVYIPIISRTLDNGYEVVKTSTQVNGENYKNSKKLTNSNIVKVSEIGLPIFLTEGFAKRHCELTIKYNNNEFKGSISQSQRFWSMYRDNIQNSINYQELIIQKANKNTLTDRLIRLANRIK